MADQLNLYSIIAFSLCGVFFLLSVYLWFRLKIGHVIVSLSGKKQKRTIAQMKNYREPVRQKSKAEVAAKVKSNKKPSSAVIQETEVLQSEEESGTMVLEPEDGTVLLDSSENEFELIDDIMLIHTKEKME